jgi:uncharacterized protein (TIGR01741 family)
MEQLYQRIASILVEMIPEDWNKVYLYAEIREGYRKVFFYYYPVGYERPVYHLDITEKFHFDEDLFDELENKLYTCFSELLNEFKIQEQEPWTHLTYILESTGAMKIKYGYEDVSHISPVEKQEKWEAEYLR